MFIGDAMVFMIPVVATLGFWVFLSVVGFAGQRRKERESYYRFEFRKRLVEAGKLDAGDVRSLMAYEQQSETTKRRQGLLVGGLVVAGAGLGCLIGLRFIEDEMVWMVGFIPLFIGLAMLAAAAFVSSSPAQLPANLGERSDSMD